MTEPKKSSMVITMGDPAGIGPEIILKVMKAGSLSHRPVVIGDINVLRKTARDLAIDIKIVGLNHIKEANGLKNQIEVLKVRDPLEKFKLGSINAACGKAAFDYICAAIGLAKKKDIDAIVTAPIHKEALALAGIKYPGHTEMLTDLSGAIHTRMMLAVDSLRVVLVTTHCSLHDVVDRANYEAQLMTIILAHQAAIQFGITHPKVAVAGLNPHAGEGGLFGREEIEIIQPAVKAALNQGIDVSGPWPSDTLFMKARLGTYDVVIAQYHDQGLIPIKYMGLDKGVNITIGLPFIRTSPDHGTAFDIVGKGIADPSSLLSAIIQADRLIENRRKEPMQ
jgi:4-hydroxythreonine-4-phosphate dehydrogenase